MSTKSCYLAFKFALASKIPLDQIPSHVSPPPARGWRPRRGDASRSAHFPWEEKLRVLWERSLATVTDLQRGVGGDESAFLVSVQCMGAIRRHTHRYLGLPHITRRVGLQFGSQKSTRGQNRGTRKALAQAAEGRSGGVSVVRGGVAESRSSRLVNHSGTPDTTKEPLVARRCATPRGAPPRRRAVANGGKVMSDARKTV